MRAIACGYGFAGSSLDHALLARLRLDRQVEPLRTADQLEKGVALGAVPGKQPVQVVHPADRFFAKTDEEIAFLQARAFRRAAALDLDHAYAPPAREPEMAH